MKKTRFDQLIILLVVVRLIFYLKDLIRWNFYLWGDNAIYAILAKRFMVFDFWNAFHPYWNPGFPIATIPYYLLTHSWEASQILVSITACILLAVVTYWFLGKYSSLLGFLAAFVILFSASFYKVVFYEGISELLYILFMCLGIFHGWFAISKNSLKSLLIASVFFGLALLTRSDIMIVFASYITLYVLLKRTKKSIVYAILSVGAFAAIVSPYIYFQSRQIGKFTISGKYAFYGTGPYYALEKDRNTTMAQDVWAVDFVDYHSPYYDPSRAKSLMLKFLKNGTLYNNFKDGIVGGFRILAKNNSDNFFIVGSPFLSLIGLVVGTIDNKFRKFTLYLFVFWIASLVWVALFMQAYYRYLTYSLPYIVYLESLALYALWNFVKNKKGVKIASLLLLLILCAIYFKNIDFQEKEKLVKRSDYHEQKTIGEYLKTHEIYLFMGRREGMSLYSGAKLVYMPSSTPEEIIDYMKKWRVEYLVVDPNEVGYAYVAPIADPRFNDKDLSLVKEFEDGILLWKLNL